MKTTVISEALKRISEETGLNIAAWQANNRGNGDCNLHVALLEPGIERAPAFRLQTGIIRHGYTSHWRGRCSANRIKRTLNIS
jgi:hypothetical protein